MILTIEIEIITLMKHVILENKIRLHSFYKPIAEYKFCSFKDLGALLWMTELGDVDDQIAYYLQEGIEFEV